MSSLTNCNSVKKLSVNEVNHLLKDVKENIIDFDEKYKGVTREKIMKILGINTWENEYFIDIPKTGGKKSKSRKTRKTKSRKTKSRKNKKIR